MKTVEIGDRIQLHENNWTGTVIETQNWMFVTILDVDTNPRHYEPYNNEGITWEHVKPALESCRSLA